MIDFHTHILPGMDDGSRTVSDSISMLKAEAKQGIREIYLTPHYYAMENSPAEFLERRCRAWSNLEPHLSANLPIVHLGAEVQYFEGICSVEDIFDLRIEGTDFLLLEMPFRTWSERMISNILELHDRPDTQVVLAHIDRYMSMQPSGLWKYLKDCGILMQCNVSYFANWKTRYRAMRMISKGEIDFLGSDCHNMSSRQPNWDKLPKKVWNAL